jgi:hypothetical protein
MQLCRTPLSKRQYIYILISLAAICLMGMACSTEAPPTDKNPSNDVQSGDLYWNTRYKFRITFPSGWEQTPGDDPRVIRKAVNVKGESINIAVQELPVYLAVLPTDIEKTVDLSKIQATFSQVYPDFEITDHSIIYIGGEKTVRYKTSATYMAGGKQVKTTLISNQFFHKGIMYTITTNESEEAEQSVSTFVFEDK